ncbi:MAG TPA: GNAT family N-acetyltransferase [Reyranella sp.]
MEFRVEQENPLQPAIRQMIEELNAYLLTLTPPEACSHMTAEQMANPATTVFIARLPDGSAVGMGALRREGGGVAEVKRMFTRPEARGQHVGSAILDRIIDLAGREGIERLVLETGDRHPEAWRLYESRGFTRCGPVLDYPDSKWSVFYEKSLAAHAVG